MILDSEENEMLKVQNLEFTYPKSKKKAVNGVSFEIKKGEIFGFLGPNGAGKTTTQKVIIGLLKGYAGNVEILGKNLQNWRTDLYNRIGVGFELPNHYQKLTARENLELFASFYQKQTNLCQMSCTLLQQRHAEQSETNYALLRSSLTFVSSNTCNTSST